MVPARQHGSETISFSLILLSSELKKLSPSSTPCQINFSRLILKQSLSRLSIYQLKRKLCSSPSFPKPQSQLSASTIGAFSSFKLSPPIGCPLHHLRHPTFPHQQFSHSLNASCHRARTSKLKSGRQCLMQSQGTQIFHNQGRPWPQIKQAIVCHRECNLKTTKHLKHLN